MKIGVFDSGVGGPLTVCALLESVIHAAQQKKES